MTARTTARMPSAFGKIAPTPRRASQATAVILFAILSQPAATAESVTVQQVEQGIRDYMHVKFDCADENLMIRVIPYEDPSLLLQGRVRSCLIIVKCPALDGIVMNDLRLEATDVTISLDALLQLPTPKLRTTPEKPASVRATITATEINKAFARMERMPIERFALKFQDDQVVCTGVYKFVFGNKLKMIADLIPKNYLDNTGTRRSEVHLVARRAWVNGLPLPVRQVNALLARVNPVFDFGCMPFSPAARNIAVNGQTLTVSTRATAR